MYQNQSNSFTSNFNIIHRNEPHLNVDRETFEKNQTLSIQKATSTTECAAKEKHIRNTILGSYRDQGAGLFWNIAQKLPISTHPIVAWKFCQVLHKMLREGHPNVLKDCMRYKQHLKDMEINWNHAAHIYARLIGSYLNCLTQRIDFHHKYTIFPGNFSLSEEELEDSIKDDVNTWFDLCIDLLNCLDASLDIQSKVFSSLDASRAFSLTGPGQCRLSPCILIILDSSPLYDHLVKVLFKLHEYLPSDALSGHRNRFIDSFSNLKSFYNACRNLQYFKNLIQVPSLPDMPPDFLVKSCEKFELTPIKVMEEIDRTPSPEPIVNDLIDTSFDVFANLEEALVFQSDPRDSEIEILKLEIMRLKAEIEQMQIMNSNEIDQFLQMIRSLEEEYYNANTSAVNAKNVLAQLRQQANNGRTQIQATEAARVHLQNAEKKVVSSEEVYKKLKEKHLSLVKEHADLLRKDAELKKFSESTKATISSNTNEMEELKAEVQMLKQQLELYNEKQTEKTLKRHEEMKRVLDLILRQSCDIIRSAMKALDGGSDKTCSAESLLRILDNTLHALDDVKHGRSLYKHTEEIFGLVQSLLHFSHSMAHSIENGGATCNMAPDGQGHDLRCSCRECGTISIKFLCNFTKNDSSDNVKKALENVLQAAQDLLPKMSDLTGGDLDDLVDQEMNSAAKAVEQASERIEALLNEARKKDTGINLEVNERILDSCTELMKMIKLLIISAKNLQQEIVLQGKGSSTTKEFYMKNSRWTEGLISAAKAVGWGATMLTDSADLVVQGNGKFEELLVWSHEIAASTAQLVAASRVKASNCSKTLSQLESASKNVNSATNRVVSSTNAGRQQLEKAGDLLADISNIVTLTQIKLKEMDSQVKVLALEQALQVERRKLGSLRKKHYELSEIREFEEKVQKPKVEMKTRTNEKPFIPLKPALAIKPALPPKPSLHS